MQAYSAVKFADACLRGMRGDAGIVQCAYVDSQVYKGLFCLVHLLVAMLLSRCNIFVAWIVLIFFVRSDNVCYR